LIERLQKIFSNNGIMSRRAAEDAISSGRVKVNGIRAYLGQCADADEDIIEIDDNPIVINNKKIYIALNKPKGFVTTLSDEKGRRTVCELIKDIPQRIYPVGRLDMNSEGLLILTNDGEFANILSHPRYGSDKTYLAWTSGYKPELLSRLNKPFDIDGYITRPAKVRCIKFEDGIALLNITIFEGRNRQIRKMCEQLDIKVLRLKRISIGKIKMGDLPVGKYRNLTNDEIDYIYSNEKVKG